MRRTVVLLLALAAVPSMSFAVCAAAQASPETTSPESVSAPTAQPALPWEFFWPGGLMLGYISMNLKQQLRRRGHEPAGRDRAFADLISLRRDDPSPEPRADGAPPSDPRR